LTELVKKSVPPERLKILIEKSPSKKLAVPEDVAAACVYLASSEAGFVTGQILYVDGGLTAVG
jgi:3-oxoacyl-[acyl-carrier protein] reductase